MVYLVSIFVYLFILTGIGVYKSRQVKNQAVFPVAGRSLSPWVMVCTMLAVWIGTGSVVGNAEKTFFTGMAALILPIGSFSGMIVLSFIASKARKFEAVSVPEIIGERFGQVPRILAVIALIMAYMVIVSYQFNAGGAVLEVITANNGEPILSAEKATIIAAVFIIAFTMLAGLKSLATMDIVTGIIITVSLLIAFPFYLVKAGGFSGMSASFAAMGDRPNHMQFFGVYSGVQIINYCLPVFLLVMGDANMYQRIFSSKSAKGARQAVTTMIFVSLLIELLIIATAWVASSMTPDPANGKYILIYAAKEFLPLPLGCLFLVTVTGIIISTADSFLLVPATTFIKDVYLNFINPKADEKRIVFVSRCIVLLFGVIAWLVSKAFAESTGFFEKALYAYTIYGAAITPCIVAALFWRRATPAGATVSILTGTVVTVAWGEAETILNHLPKNVSDYIHEVVPVWISDLKAVLPAITLSVVALLGVSLLTKTRQSLKTE